MKSIVPCLTRNRCGSGGHWSFSRQRFLTTSEMFRLMGHDPNRLIVPAGVSDRQVREMLGNGWDVSLIKRVLYRLLPASGLVSRDVVGSDPRGDGDSDSDNLEALTAA